jgi:excisionase family DNA binding protein
MPADPYLTVGDVVARLRISEYQVAQAYRSGVLPHRRIGKLVRFTEADLEKFQANTQASGSGLTNRSRARRRSS